MTVGGHQGVIFYASGRLLHAPETPGAPVSTYYQAATAAAAAAVALSVYSHISSDTCDKKANHC